MKTVFCKFVSIIGIAVVCASCVRICPIRGNGDLVTFEKSVSTFEKIKSSGAAEIRYHASEEYRVVVTVDSNLEEYVEIFAKNNVLHIGTENSWGNSWYSFTKYLVDVYCPVLKSITLSGSGSLQGVDEIIAPIFEAVVSGSGKIDGTVVCDNFSVEISGSGKITVDGTSRDADISISGSGKFSGNDFITKNASINISGSGKANICVTDNLDATISGSGEINYCGQPKILSKISGSDRIRKHGKLRIKKQSRQAMSGSKLIKILYTFAILIMSANTPAAVTSAPAQYPLMTIGSSK